MAGLSPAAFVEGKYMKTDGLKQRMVWARTTIAITVGLLGTRDLCAQNAIVVENLLPGNPPSEWDISGAGSESIQGFATDISVNLGETIEFKVRTDATDYRIDIYRLGYYNGDGARFITTVNPSATLPQVQPDCVFDPETRCLDCGNWAVSASWTVPGGLVSGLYLAKLVRDDGTPGSSHIAFVVRDDFGGSQILFQTSDTTWQAYNLWGESSLCGGNSLYQGPGGKADKVSYNRPFSTRGCVTEDWLFNAEYPMVRWLERNGYDVSYSTDVDSDRRGDEILEHDVFLSVGHDEYWSRAQRENVEAALAAGVHLGFFSGNEIYWKTRWEDSIDGSATPYRTLVCYKEGTLGENNCGGKCDPLPDVWTGLWRDGCDFPSADGCEPENALSGQISWVGTTAAIIVPAEYGSLPFWRNTDIADLLPGESTTLGSGTLGYEWDPYQAAYAAFYPPGLLWLSNTTVGSLTHHLSIYETPNGAIVFGAGTVQWSWGLDSHHDRSSAPADIRMQQATVNLLADMGVQPDSLQNDLVPGTPPGEDTVPPVIIARAPGADATGVSIVTHVTATFNEPVVGATISFELRDASSTLVPATVTYSSLDRTATLVPDADLDYTMTYTATVSSTQDLAGNPMDSDAWSFTTSGPPVCPCSLWGDLDLGDDAGHSDVQAVELGVKFRSLNDGYVIGIRFYKALTNTGTHVGHLWATDGTLLGEVTFAGESASGWQEALLDNPVPVTAGTTYIASYHAPFGQYMEEVGYFAGAGYDNPPLRALFDGEDGPNSVYAYGPSGSFPTSTYQSANYYVDLLFDVTAIDETPPVVAARTPAAGASGVPITTPVTVTFNEPINGATLSFELRDAGNMLVSSIFIYDPPTRTATLQLESALDYEATYTVNVSGAQDGSGNAMVGTDSWSFTTGSPPGPPPDEGPGGPILVIADAANPFGRYFAEILRTEGFNYFTVTDISLVTPAVLADHEVVILGEMTLSAADVTMLSDWVTAGGQLIASRPDPQLAGLLGLAPAGGGPLAEGYLLIDTASAPGLGLVDETIQYHSGADLYTLDGAVSLATLYADAATPAGNPAVTINSVGGSGGRAAAFSYDLARSVVYTRQGNPAWAGQERDGVSPIRSDDQFYGDAAGDPQTDWIDLTKVAIPQADEQQRLLANLILDMAGHPWPRFWYLPSFHKAAVIMTGDQHGCCASTIARFQTYVDQSPAGCSVDDWECVRASSYVYANSNLSDAEALAWHTLGFELGVHVNTDCADWTEAELEDDYTNQLATFAALFPSLPQQTSERTHCIAWSTWVGQAVVKAQFGIRLDVNYYYWPPDWVLDRPGMFTGSGMPMRFADLDGTIIDVYQATTQMTDESSQSYPATINALLDNALGSEGYYGVFCANMHTDSASHAGSDAIVASALARGVPVVSGRQMADWLDGRNASVFSALDWAGSILSFDVSVGTGANNLRGMVPAIAPSGTLMTLSRNGGAVAYSTETIKGVEYAVFEAAPGSYQAVYLPDSTPPVISNLTAIPDNDGTAVITWTTNEPADSLVEYGDHYENLGLSVSSPALVTSHSLTLLGLNPDTTYYYRATSADGNGNSATEPPLPTLALSFTTPGLVCAGDDLAADFSAGAPDAGAYIAETDDGEIILAPAAGAEFFGTALPAGWAIQDDWTGSGSATVAAGTLTVEQANVGPNALFAPGRSLEFVATFTAGEYGQHVGFATDYSSQPWAMFSTGTAFSGSCPTCLQVRTRASSGATTDTTIDTTGALLDSPHRFRIDWTASGVDFYVDGSLVAQEAAVITSGMSFRASDINTGPSVVVDWVRLSDYSPAGSFESQVFDAGGQVAWGAVLWTAQEPAGTALDVFVRTGNTATPDASWGPWVPIAASGQSAGGASQYVQYRADLSTTDGLVTPVLEDLSISCAVGDDVTPPTVQAHTPGAGAVDILVGTSLTATFSEPMDPATINASTFTLAPSGGGPAVTATVTYEAGTLTAMLDPDAELAYSTTYDARVTTGAEDAAGNGLASDYVWSFTTAAPDSTPPSVTVRSPLPGAIGVLVQSDVTATFSEDMDPATIDGATFTLTPSGGSPVAATVSYDPGSRTATLDPFADLDLSTVHEARVTTGARDVAGNGLAADEVWSFTTQAPVCLVDDLFDDFSAGTPGPGTYVAETVDGEVILAPQEGAEFDGSSLPADWGSVLWDPGGSVTIAGGQATLDAARINTDAFYGPPRSVEFVATFQAAGNQHIGFGGGTDTLNVYPWALFSTGGTGAALQTRVQLNASTYDNFTVPGSYLGTPHRYRIDWLPDTFYFFIDGTLVHNTPIAVPDDMRPAVSDLVVGGAALAVDWLRMTPYSASGSFESRIVDAGATADWNVATWTSTKPPGTSLGIFVRTGDTPVPDGTWTAYAQVLSSGDLVGVSSRYIQYRADLATTDTSVTPALESLTVNCNVGPDTFPPLITNVAAVPGAEGTTATVTWDTDEPADSLVVYGTSPGALSQSASDAAFVTAHSIGLTDLLPDTTYYYRVTSEDPSANSATEPQPPASPLTFTTPVAICGLDDTVADFSAGTPGAGTYVVETDDGEVILAPTGGSEFEGTTLPAGWEAVAWPSGGGATVSGGSISVNGARANTTALYAPGRAVEFVATLGPETLHHVGFADDFSGVPWAIFSTHNQTPIRLWARTASPGQVDTDLGTGPVENPYIGNPHLYRIEWDASEIRFYVDGALAATHAATIATNMRPIISDFNNNATSVSVDWIRMTPYAAAGTFESRIVDAGTPVGWQNVTWTSTEPAGTSIDISVRTGDTPVPDGTWTAYAPIAASGDPVNQTGRYLQYSADLATIDTEVTPALEDVTFVCGAANTAPEANDDEATVVQGDPVDIDVLANDIDTDGTLDPASVTIAVPPSHGTVTNIDPLTGVVTYEHDGSAISTDTFQYTVDDDYGTPSNQATVTVDVVNEVMVDIQLAGVSLPTTRCIHFELRDCGGGTTVLTEEIAFSAGAHTGLALHVPIGTYDCLRARDPLHTLWRLDSTFTTADGFHYVADFTDQSGGGGGPDQSLMGGNANGDAYVDILDFGTFIGQLSTNPGASTTCADTGPNTDFDSDGTVFTSDYTYIQGNFLESDDGDCCPGPMPMSGTRRPTPQSFSGPITRVSVQELRRRGLHDLIAADLNHDGWLDVADMVAFMGGAQPAQGPGAGPAGMSIFRTDDGRWLDADNWSYRAVPDGATDVVLAVTAVVDAPGATANRVLVRDGGALRISGGGLTAAVLEVESGGVLHLENTSSMLNLSALTLHEGAMLLWYGGVIEIEGGVYTQANLDLLVGRSAYESTLRLVDGAEARITRDTLIGVSAQGVGVIEVVGGTLTTGRALMVGHGGEGWLVLDDGAVTAAEVHVGPQGAILGTGVIAADVNSSGEVRPGVTDGGLLVQGSYGQMPDAALVIEVVSDGTGAAAARLETTGLAALSGTLVVPADGAVPLRAGDELVIVTAGAVVGRFDRVETAGLRDGLRWILHYRDREVVLAVSTVSRE